MSNYLYSHVNKFAVARTTALTIAVNQKPSFKRNVFMQANKIAHFTYASHKLIHYSFTASTLTPLLFSMEY